jgi:hypothetical protein
MYLMKELQSRIGIQNPKNQSWIKSYHMSQKKAQLFLLEKIVRIARPKRAGK